MEITNDFSPADINIELQRVLSFNVFKSSQILSRFLEYIILETASGRQHNLKEYSIAVDVLNRPSDFDSHDNAVVRIHAGRLRRALNEYYLTEGANNPICIHIPKGGYIPQFRQQGNMGITIDMPISRVLPDITVNPTVAIFPFKVLSQNEETNKLSLMLWEEMSAELSRFHDISVIGYYLMEMTAKIQQNILEAGKLIGADYIIAGSLQHIGRRIRIRVNLLITATGELILTKLLDRDASVDLLDLQDEIIESVIGAAGGYYGLIFQKLEKASPMKVNSNVTTRKGIDSYYQYARMFSEENYYAAVTALEDAVKINPDHALSWAMLGEIYLKAIPLLIKPIENPVEEGYRCAMQALKVDPLCQHAWHTLTLAYLIKKDKEACLYAGRQCIELNPNCSVMVAGVALRLIAAGYFDEGFPIMDKAIKKNLYYPWWMNMGFIFYHLHKKEYATAFSWAEKMDAADTFWDPCLKAATLAYMGEYEQGSKYLSKLLKLKPESPSEIKYMLSSYIMPEELIAQIITGLETVGLQVDPTELINRSHFNISDLF